MDRRQFLEPLIIKHIKSNPHCSVNEITDALGAARRSIDGAVARLLDRGEIHIAAYECFHSGAGRAARLFLYGPGVNARPPKPTKDAQRKAKSEWQRKKRARLAVMRRAAQNDNVFGVLMAQIQR